MMTNSTFDKTILWTPCGLQCNGCRYNSSDVLLVAYLALSRSRRIIFLRTSKQICLGVTTECTFYMRRSAVEVNYVMCLFHAV